MGKLTLYAASSTSDIPPLLSEFSTYGYDRISKYKPHLWSVELNDKPTCAKNYFFNKMAFNAETANTDEEQHDTKTNTDSSAEGAAESPVTLYASSDSAEIQPRLSDFKASMAEICFDDQHPHLWLLYNGRSQCIKDYYHNSPYEPKTEVFDPVSRPAHYASTKVECIDAMKAVFGDAAVQDFCLLNTFKYLWRRKDKGNKQQDIDKALWYFDKFKEIVNG